MRIGILGPLEVVADGRPAEIGGARLRALLTLLALDAGRPLTVERIIDDLWEDRAPATAPNALQALVSRLRAVIGRGSVESRPGAYRLVVPRAAVDAHDFEARVLAARRMPGAEARSDELGAALGLWRGPALADAAGLPFADGPAARLEALRRAALDERIDADLLLGRHEGLIPELKAMAAAEPLREPLRGRLIRALYGAGRQSEALSEYASVKRALAEELGVDPSPDLEALHIAVLRQDPALLPGAAEEPSPPAATSPVSSPGPDTARTKPNHNLRARLTSFIGRDEDLARIGGRLAAGRLVTLTGPGGSGKTRLSLETAERQLDRMPDGVWLAELAPVSDPAETPLAVLTALGLREAALVTTGHGRVALAETNDPLDRLAAALAGKRLLLVLDNCEHLLDAAARLADRVLADCPGVRVLATSREPLGITGEALWPVEPLEPPPDGAGVAEALANPAVRLLADRAVAASPRFAVTPANVASIVRICRALDGMPLAIELAAVRLRAMTPAQLADRLGDRFRLLAGGSRTALPRHQTLRAVVEWSWDLLDEAERALWRRLSVFAGGATVEAAERVCAGPELDPAEVLDVLTALVDKSLLIVTAAEPGPVAEADDPRPRYRMLETIRAYGAERLAEAGEEDRTRRAHAEYLADLAETAEPRLYRHDQLYWMARLNAEHDDLHAALRWTMSVPDAALAVRLCASLGWYWFLHGMVREAGEHYVELFSMPDLPEDQTTVLALAHGVMLTFDGPWENSRSVEWLRRAQEIGERHGGPVRHPVVRAMTVTMNMYVTGWSAEAMEIVRPLLGDPDPWVRGIGYFIHAQVAINFGRHDGVDGDFLEAERAFREAGDRWGLSFALTGKAELLAWRGEHRAAAVLYEEALRLNEPLGSGMGMFIQVHARLANELYLLGERERAKTLLATALREAERLAFPDALAGIHQQFGEFARREGDRAEAIRRFDRAEELCPRTGGPPQYRALILASRAQLDAEHGDVDAARARLREALADAVQAVDHPIAAQVLTGHAFLAIGEGDPARAARLLGAAHGVRGARDLSQPETRAIEDAAREALGEAAFTASYEKGRAQTFDDVLDAFGLARPVPPPALAGPSGDGPATG
ncbi:ATP-binding protein [Actinomadura rugatobispora]|uniref:ATP-binding protein n=1 Tax=Actinomadura rugatobispora TaxID=1994 RepID=A0ABW1A5R9_9ACTN|nr:BTAD domain-containing putative transcriptional regulator [Actinomadura rugatobispora]